MDIIREKHEEGYYADDQDFNNAHFIKELTQSDLSHCYLYCLLKPFISSQYHSPTGAFGFERLSSVEFVQQLVRLNNPLLDQFITFNFYTTVSPSAGAKPASTPSNLLYFCMDSLFRFPRNNILHNLVHDTVAAIFGRDEKRKRDRKASGPSSRSSATAGGSGSYTIYGSSGNHRIRGSYAGNSAGAGGFQGKLNRKLGKYKRVAEPYGGGGGGQYGHDDESNEMDIEVTAQLCPEEAIEDEQELKARRELMARKWAKESMKLRRVALVECGLLEKLVAYFHALRAEKDARRRQQLQQKEEAAAAAAAKEAAVDSDGDLTLNSAESDLIKAEIEEVEELEEIEEVEEGNDTESPSTSTSSPSSSPSSSSSTSSSSSSSSSSSTEEMKRILAGATWAGEENLGPVVKIVNRMLRGRNNQYLTCSTHLLTGVLGVDEALARAWFEVVHADLREINALDNSRPFEKPHVSFSSPLKNSFDNYHLNLLKFHRR